MFWQTKCVDQYLYQNNHPISTVKFCMCGGRQQQHVCIYCTWPIAMKVQLTSWAVFPRCCVAAASLLCVASDPHFLGGRTLLPLVEVNKMPPSRLQHNSSRSSLSLEPQLFCLTCHTPQPTLQLQVFYIFVSACLRHSKVAVATATIFSVERACLSLTNTP